MQATTSSTESSCELALLPVAMQNLSCIICVPPNAPGSNHKQFVRDIPGSQVVVRDLPETSLGTKLCWGLLVYVQQSPHGP